jgi:hypothetical protein
MATKKKAKSKEPFKRLGIACKKPKAEAYKLLTDLLADVYGKHGLDRTLQLTAAAVQLYAKTCIEMGEVGGFTRDQIEATAALGLCMNIAQIREQAMK